MKKLLAIVLSISIIFTCSVIAVYADSIDANVEISYDKSNSKYYVVVPDDDHYSSLKPNITVNTDFKNAKVTLNESNVQSTISNGAVTFKITGGNLVYIIEEIAPIPIPSSNGYKFPKTCID